MRRLFALLAVCALVGALPACQTLKPGASTRISASASAASLDHARQAWRRLELNAGNSATKNADIRDYNRAVYAVVRSLHKQEGTAAWSHSIRLSGTHPWQLDFEQQARGASARTFALAEFSRCRVASDVKLTGFDRVVAHDGLGIPVVLAQDNPSRVARPFHPPNGEFLPATAVLEFPPSPPGEPTVALLRFYNPFAVSRVTVGHHAEPLAENLTAPLQWALTNDKADKRDGHRPHPSASGEEESGLFFVSRYDATKVPVVFTHGMLSGPVVWKNTINEMWADPGLRRRYQPVLFMYPSKLSIPASAARLRQLLARSRQQLDPAHQNAGFSHIVVVGHSMGGLLARMQVIDSGNSFWRAFFAASPRKVGGMVDPKTLQMLRTALFFKREPDVKLVVFISTPHRGAEIANNGALRATMRLLLFLPKTAKNRLDAWVSLPPAYIQPVLRNFHDWGVEGTENLSTTHPFFAALARRPIEAPYHSIIAVRNNPDLRHGSDGIVPYSSAHLDGAVSETFVPYGHGCLERSETVQAVLKILRKAR